MRLVVLGLSSDDGRGGEGIPARSALRSGASGRVRPGGAPVLPQTDGGIPVPSRTRRGYSSCSRAAVKRSPDFLHALPTFISVLVLSAILLGSICMCEDDVAEGPGVSWKDPAGAWELTLPGGWIAGTKEETLAAAERSRAASPVVLDALRRTSVPFLALLPAEAGAATDVTAGAGGRQSSARAGGLPAIAAIIRDEGKGGEIEAAAHSVAAARTAAMGVLAEWLMPGCIARIETVRPAAIGGRNMFEMRGTLELGGANLRAAFYAAPSGGRMYYLVAALPDADGPSADAAGGESAARGADMGGQAAGQKASGGARPEDAASSGGWHPSRAADPQMIAAAWKLAKPAKTASFVYTRTGRRLVWAMIGAAALAAIAATIAAASRQRPPTGSGFS